MNRCSCCSTRPRRARRCGGRCDEVMGGSQVASAGVVIASRCRSMIESRQPKHEAPHMTHLHSSLPAWQTVDAHAREIGGAHLRDLDAADPKRWQNLHLE